jgi:hypothetical protein
MYWRLLKLATPIPPNIKMVGYPWRDFMSKRIKSYLRAIEVGKINEYHDAMDKAKEYRKKEILEMQEVR